MNGVLTVSLMVEWRRGRGIDAAAIKGKGIAVKIDRRRTTDDRYQRGEMTHMNGRIGNGQSTEQQNREWGCKQRREARKLDAEV